MVFAGPSRPVARQPRQPGDGQAVSSQGKSAHLEELGNGGVSYAARGAVFGVALGCVLWITISILAVLI